MNVASEGKQRLRSSRTLGLFMSVRCYRHLGPYGPEDTFFSPPTAARDRPSRYGEGTGCAAAARTIFSRVLSLGPSGP